MHKRAFLKQMGLGLGSVLCSRLPKDPLESTASLSRSAAVAPKKIAFILFDGITLLDFIGVYDPISRLKSMNYLPQLIWHSCARTPIIKDSHGLQVVVDKTQPNLRIYDAIIVPGGFGTRPLQRDQDFIQWIKTAQNADYKISVCTGSLILGAAGFLEGKKATTNFNEYNTLAPYCEEVIKETIVEDQNVITAGAVASSIELGLYLCEKWAGGEAKAAISEKMAYKN